MTTIAELPDEPKYSIKTVCTETGIRAVTLRAWERRYHLLSPARGLNRYRRYSERDIAILRWVKQRVDSGISISGAAGELKAMQETGAWPESSLFAGTRSYPAMPHPMREYADELTTALLARQESRAAEMLDEAQSILDLARLSGEVIIPSLVRIGEAWERGEILIATEHFASAFLRGRLMHAYQSMPIRRGAASVLAGCAPSEQHEIGSLIFAALLRQAGLRVEYLGPELPLSDLLEYAKHVRPRLICLAATLESSALELSGFDERLAALRPRPLFGYGGRAFNLQPALRERVAGHFLGETLEAARETVQHLLDQ